MRPASKKASRGADSFADSFTLTIPMTGANITLPLGLAGRSPQGRSR